MDKLLEISDPTKINSASIDIDVELNKLQINLKVLTEMIHVVGHDVVEAEHNLNNKMLNCVSYMTESWLKKNVVPKANKFQHAKFICCDYVRVLNDLKNDYKRYTNLYNTWEHWINIYKHLRKIT